MKHNKNAENINNECTQNKKENNKKQNVKHNGIISFWKFMFTLMIIALHVRTKNENYLRNQLI